MEKEKYLLKYISNISVVIFFVITQVSFISTWPDRIAQTNISLIFAFFLTLIISYRKGLIFAVSVGLLLDLYSVKVFGSISFSMLASVLVVNYLFDHFFTNRSYYSLSVLGFIGTFVYSICLILIRSIMSFFELSLFQFEFTIKDIYSIIGQGFLNVSMLFILFFSFNFLSKKAKNAFLFNE